MIRKITCFVAFILLSSALFSQSKGFERVYQLQNNLEHLNVDGVTMPDGQFVALSLVKEKDSLDYKYFNLVGLDDKGATQWSRDYVVEDSIALLTYGGDLRIVNTDQLAINLNINRDTSNQILMVTDFDGNPLYSRSYVGMDSLASMRFNPIVHQRRDSLDTIFYQGGNGIFDTINTAYISSLDTLGAMNWAKQIAQVEYDTIDVMTMDIDTIYSDLNIGAFTNNLDGGMTVVGTIAENGHFFMSGISRAGDLEWNREIFSSMLIPQNAEATGVVQLPDSSYLMIGKMFTFNVEYDGFVIKTDSIGNVIWSKKVDFLADINDLHLNNMTLAPDNTINLGARRIGSDTTVIAMKMDFNGEVVWQSFFKTVATTHNGLDGMDNALNGGFAYFTNDGDFADTTTAYIVVADSLGMTMCNDTIMQNLITDDVFESDSLNLIAFTQMGTDTLMITDQGFNGWNNPVVSLEDQIFCSNIPFSHTFYATLPGAIAYEWTEEGDVLSTTDSLVVTSDGTYNVVVTMGEGVCYIICDEVVVDLYEEPELSLFTTEPRYCSDGVMTVRFIPNVEAEPYTVLWSTTAVTEFIDVPTPGTYSVTITDACGLTAEGSIDVMFPVLVNDISLNTDLDAFCTTGNYMVSVALDPIDAENVTFLWDDPAGTNMSTLSVAPTVTTTYTVTVTDYCLNEFIEMVTLDPIPVLVPDDAIITAECQELGVELTLNGVLDPSHVIVWSNGETDEITTIVPYGTGVHTVSITDFCGTTELSFDLNDLPNSIPNLSMASECNADNIDLSIEGDLTGLTFLWSPNGETTSTINVEYGTVSDNSVVVTDLCRNTLELTPGALENTLPTDLEINDICGEDSILVQVTGSLDGLSFLWSTGQTTSSINADFESGPYIVTITDICRNETELRIEETQKCLPMEWPNVFTPDFRTGDDMENYNREFGPKVSTPEGITEYQLNIYNRWGEKVFEGTTVEEQWNGFYKDKAQATDVYLWYATYQVFGREVSEKGNLTLLR